MHTCFPYSPSSDVACFTPDNGTQDITGECAVLLLDDLPNDWSHTATSIANDKRCKGEEHDDMMRSGAFKGLLILFPSRVGFNVQ